jgi:uncharacterized protein YbjT (DUF2867 family)
MTVVIAGGSGYLGRALCARLLAESHAVTVLSRGGGAGLPPQVRVVSWRADGSAGAWASVGHQANSSLLRTWCGPGAEERKRGRRHRRNSQAINTCTQTHKAA